ncbi:hypothetical protein B4N84_28380 [Flavobacterium sp. IR1]|nr:hypothetical protein B4N84_28380 [Flavobacterium sp. IR1]
MNLSKISLEFELNLTEIRKLNNMYFRRLCKEKVTFFLILILFYIIFFNFFTLKTEDDLIEWELQNLVLIILFITFYCFSVNAICNVILELISKLVLYTDFIGKYKLNFAASNIYVQAPLGTFTYKWCQIEKAVLTKDFFFLYIKDDSHIISISNHTSDGRNMKELITFVESNRVNIIKV